MTPRTTRRTGRPSSPGPGRTPTSFRFIVSPEDSARLADLKPIIRDLMRQMEQDLDTKLDWVAIDHFNSAQ